MRARVQELAVLTTRAGQTVGGLSREVAQLQRTWDRLGERLRSLMARAIETRDQTAPPALDLEEGDGPSGEEEEQGGGSF